MNSNEWLLFDCNNLQLKGIPQINDIKLFTTLKLQGLLDPKSEIESIKSEFNYDILNWIDNLGRKKLSECHLKDKKIFYFEYTQEQINNRNDYFDRYGKDINALSKIVTRISNLESQFRKIKISELSHPRDIYKKSAELFTRYALSNQQKCKNYKKIFFL